MKRPIKFYIPTTVTEDWKYLLAEPERDWRTGYSTKALALMILPRKVKNYLKTLF
jgi:hypothetical protein